MNKPVSKHQTYVFKIFAILLFIFVLSVFVSLKTSSDDKNCVFNNQVVGFRSFLLSSADRKFTVPLGNIPHNCYYSFYDGVFKAGQLVPSGKDKLESFCDKIGSQKRWNLCLFDLGISATFSKRESFFSKEDLLELVDLSIDRCTRYNYNGIDCITGVYTGVNLAYQNDLGDSNFPVVESDPFWVCTNSKFEDLKLQCMRNIVSYLYFYFNGDHEKVLKFISDAQAETYGRFELKLTYFSSLAYVGDFGISTVQTLCNSLDNYEDRYACIEGYATGIDEAWKSGEELDGVINFCLSDSFTYDEIGHCLRRGFTELPGGGDLKLKCKEASGGHYNNYCDLVEEYVRVDHWPKYD